jgi:hypothetical protein
MSSQGRRSYDIAASGQAQANLIAVAGHLETVICQRDGAVKAAMADFSADGVSAEYHAKEVQWNHAADEVRSIIALLKTALQRNDDTATTTLARARLAVGNIG